MDGSVDLLDGRSAEPARTQRCLEPRNLLQQDDRQRVGPGPPAVVRWKGADVWLIFLHCLQVNFSWTIWITFHCRGMTSSVSVIVAHLQDAVRPAAGASRRSVDTDPLTRQVVRE